MCEKQAIMDTVHKNFESRLSKLESDLHENTRKQQCEIQQLRAELLQKLEVVGTSCHEIVGSDRLGVDNIGNKLAWNTQQANSNPTQCDSIDVLQHIQVAMDSCKECHQMIGQLSSVVQCHADEIAATKGSVCDVMEAVKMLGDQKAQKTEAQETAMQEQITHLIVKVEHALSSIARLRHMQAKLESSHGAGTPLATLPEVASVSSNSLQLRPHKSALGTLSSSLQLRCPAWSSSDEDENRILRAEV